MIHINANLALGTLVADRMHLNRLALLIFTIWTVHKFPLMKGTPYIEVSEVSRFLAPFLRSKGKMQKGLYSFSPPL